jgi:hypothetical protein
MSNPSMSALKASLYELAKGKCKGTYQGWMGGEDPPDPGAHGYLEPGWYRCVSLRLMYAHLDATTNPGAHAAMRAEFVRVLTNPRVASAQKRVDALNYLVEHYPLASGAHDVLAERHPGRAGADPLAYEPGEVKDVALALLPDERRLRYLVRVAILLTTRGRRLHLDDLDELGCDEQELNELAASVHSKWDTQNRAHFMVALPHGPMSTLTRESANLGTLVGQGDASWRNAGAKLVENDGQQLALVYDQRLVLKDNTIDDTYMRVPLEGPLETGFDAVGALTSALKGAYEQTLARAPSSAQLARLTEDIPRVVAGMFRVAAQQRNTSFLNAGEFVDAESALLLTDLVGLDRNQKTCRDRVNAVRAMLETIEISRSVRGTNGRSVTWTGPIIQRLKDKVEVTDDLPGELKYTRKNLGVWRIAPELWRMQDPTGSAASFMLLDDRAFNLDTRTSKPFNFYWTIIQRAYNAPRARNDDDKFDATGTFRPTLSVLYTMSGMDRKSDAHNPRRVCDDIKEYLDLLVDNELIDTYEPGVLARDHFSLGRDMSRRVSITLPGALLKYLPHNAFRENTNTFKA